MTRTFFAIFMAVALAACATLTAAQEDPAEATRAALKKAELACLGCALPNLPEKVKAACEELEPVCEGLAGACNE